MAKVLGKDSIDSAVSKVVEMGNEFVINGHVYDKNSLSPVPLAFVPTKASTQNEILLYRTLMLGGSFAPNLSRRNFAIDINDANTCYVFYSGLYRRAYADKIVKTNQGYEIQASTDVFSDNPQGYNRANNEVFEVIGQDTDRLYVLMHREYSYNNDVYYAYVYGVNKNDMSQAWEINYGNSRLTHLKSTDSTIYLAVTQRDNVLKIVRVNKVTGSSTTIFTSSLSGWSNLSLVSELDENDNFYAIRDRYYESNFHEVIIKKYNINFDTDVVIETDVALDLTKLSPVEDERYIPLHDGTYGAYELLRHKDADGTYITLVVFDYGYRATYMSADYCALYTFKIIDVDTFELISFEKFSPKLYRGLMPLYNNTVLILADENGVNFYGWNSIEKKFEKTTDRQVPCIVVGADMANNVWLQYNTGEIELLANTLPIKIETDFVQDEYYYNGTDIQSYVFVRAINYLGNRLATRLQLQLIGDVVFTENGTKTITKTSSANEDLKIPVTITGSGILQVNAKIV